MARAAKPLRRVMRDAASFWGAAMGSAMSSAMSSALTPMLAPVLTAATPSSAGRVVEVADFGSNPGALRMLVYAPAKKLRPGAPLIVVLHGCGQDAEMFARNAGWIGLAEQIGAALVLPEQSSKNSNGRCFNWFQPGDVRRGGGEALSVRQMVSAAIQRFGSDPRRVFIVGLSAGGAMALAMLSAYPAVFAAGAVVAGMPVGAARGGATALLRMRHADRLTSRAALAEAVQRAAPKASKPRVWPRLSIWHGERDKIIDPGNAEIIAAQWSAVNGLGETPASESWPMPGIRRRIWKTPRRVVVEFWTLAEMGHGFPIDASASGGGGREGFGVINAHLSAARHIAAFWGIA